MNLSNLPDPTAVRPRNTSTAPAESVWTSLTNRQRIAIQRLILRAEELGRAITHKEVTK